MALLGVVWCEPPAFHVSLIEIGYSINEMKWSLEGEHDVLETTLFCDGKERGVGGVSRRANHGQRWKLSITT